LGRAGGFAPGPTISGAVDRTHVRRLAIAFAAAVALHEIAAGFIHGRAPQAVDQNVPAEPIVVTIHTPVPTAPPTPRPTPEPIVTFSAHASPAQAAPRAAARVRHTGGRAAPLAISVTPPPSIHATPGAIALATADAAGVQNGGTGVGAGPGASGEGGANGSGSGGEGNGTGASVQPCGEVWLDPVPGSLVLNKDGSRTVRVHIEVTMSDGSTVGDVLGWRFKYRREKDDPFAKAGSEIPMLLQLPPPGYDLEATQTAATVFAVKHTGADGYTDLEDCPKPQSPPR
jgi:hypothetical protein